MPPFWPKTVQNKILGKTIKIEQLGLRRGLWGHSFNLPYSLELIFDFSEKQILGDFQSFFLIPDTWYLIPDIWYLISWYLDIRISGHLDIWISGYLDIWISGFWWPSPLRTSVWCIPGRGLFFPGITRPWILDLIYVISGLFEIKKTRNLTRSWLHQVSARNDWYEPVWWQKGSPPHKKAYRPRFRQPRAIM